MQFCHAYLRCLPGVHGSTTTPLLILTVSAKAVKFFPRFVSTSSINCQIAKAPHIYSISKKSKALLNSTTLDSQSPQVIHDRSSIEFLKAYPKSFRRNGFNKFQTSHDESSKKARSQGKPIIRKEMLSPKENKFRRIASPPKVRLQSFPFEIRKVYSLPEIRRVYVCQSRRFFYQDPADSDLKASFTFS